MLRLDSLTSRSSVVPLLKLTEQQVKNIILKAPKKSCMLDPVPTYLVHECLDDLILTITAIINESLVSGIVHHPSSKLLCFPF